MENCIWCGHDYGGLITQQVEAWHLSQCMVYQGLPVAEVKEGKDYIRLPAYPAILVERRRPN